MERWVGKVAVVTGASVGIGADIAKILAEKGVIVVGLARRLDKLEELSRASKGKIYVKQCDILNEKQIIEIFDWVKEFLGGVDILVNSAGVLFDTPLMTGETKDWSSTLNTNILGMCVCIREALKTMRMRGDNGHIFNLNSVAGHQIIRVPNLSIGMYGATKFAITSLTESLRMELLDQKSLIKVTSISPGTVKTEMIGPLFKDTSKFAGLKEPDLLAPKDVTEALLYALSSRPYVQVHEIILVPMNQRYS